MPSSAAATAMCQIRSSPSRPRTATALTATKFTASTAMMMRALRKPVGRDAADQDERDQPDAQAGGHQRQRGRVVVERHDLKRHHDGPHALGEDQDSDTAAISRRYSRNWNGASTRQPPGTRCCARLRLMVDLRAHLSMVAESSPGVQRFSWRTAPRSTKWRTALALSAPKRTFGRNSG